MISPVTCQKNTRIGKYLFSTTKNLLKIKKNALKFQFFWASVVHARYLHLAHLTPFFLNLVFNYTYYKLQFIRTDFIMKKVSFKTKLCCEIYFWKSKAFCRRCVAFFVFMFNQTSSALVSRKKEVLGYIWTKINICLLNCP